MTAAARQEDDDERAWLAHVRPPQWKNPTPRGRYNLVVIGGGAAGLVSAFGAAALGARVALVERDRLGGDCLNAGCVPSKALLASARAAHQARHAAQLGVAARDISVDFAQVMARVRRLRATLAPHDSAARLTAAGVDVYFGEGRFVARDALEVGDQRLRFSRALIATGARAALPDVPGLAAADYLTNDTVFELTALPEHLLVLGAGPVGCELAQAFRRLGSRVTLLERADRVLPQEDPDAAAIIQARLAAEGVTLVLGARIACAEPGSTLVLSRAGGEERIRGDALLVSAGRTPNVAALHLAAAGVATARGDVLVDDLLRTSNRRIFAAGDVASEVRLTHAADAMARVALRNALFFGRQRVSSLTIPRCTYTDPEVAHVGISAAAAAARSDLRTFTVPLSAVDRAVLDGETEGFARVHADRRGQILGATFVARHAGESIGELALAMRARLGLAELAATIHPYPTQAEALRKLADAFLRTKLTPRARRWLEALLRWRRR